MDVAVGEREIDLHEGIVDGDDEDFARILELGVGEVAGDVGVGATGGEGGGDSDDDAFPGGELFGEVDLVAWGIFEEIDGGDGVACFDLGCGSARWRGHDVWGEEGPYHDCGCAVEESGCYWWSF